MHLIWKEAVLHVLRDYHPHEVKLQVIYHEISKYRELTEKNYENTKYGEPQYQHEVRAALSSLKGKGWAESPRRGVYVLKDK